jgi:hypothetical protein
MLLPKFQRKTKKERERKTEIYYFYQFIMTPYYYNSPKQKAYTPHVLHLPIYYISHLFTHFTTTIYLPILLQQFLLVLLYLLSMYRLTNYPFIILQLYL